MGHAQTETVRRRSMQPPMWAVRSIAEDGGVTHERVSGVRPVVRQWAEGGPINVPTEVSISVSDLSTGEGWVRTEPTVQLEGGTYSVDGARRLHQALAELLATLEAAAR